MIKCVQCTHEFNEILAMDLRTDLVFCPYCGKTQPYDVSTIKENPKVETFDFGTAIKLLKQGYKVARLGWNGKGIFIELQRPDEHSKMTHPYIFIDTTGLQTNNPHAPKDRVPWLASQTDMLAEDYVLVEVA